MTKLAVDYQDLQTALTSLEQNNNLLDRELYELATSALREKLTTFQQPKVTPMQQYDEVSILVADMSGFTTMSQFMDAENVRDTINAVWAKLDSVITAWGGRVEKHTGDGVIALFGLGLEKEESAENAVQAALDMQLELALFNNDNLPHKPRRDGRHVVRMRIGLHRGQVYYGTYGTNAEQTAVGDTVTVANRLEQHAPVDGILISHQMYEKVHPYFDVSVMELEKTSSGTLPRRAYVVNREKPQAFRRGRGHTSFLDTRFVGRSDELHLLQETMQSVVETQQCRVVTISGDAGVGKSRLLYEFERMLALQPEHFNLLRAGAQNSIDQQPYALFRALLNNYFDIHRRHIPSVARERLVRGITQILTAGKTKSLTQAHFITHLMGFAASDSPYLQDVIDDPRQLRRYAYQDMLQLFKALMVNDTALILFLEDFHLADESSLNFLDFLIQECAETPMLIIALTRPSLFVTRPSWRIAAEIDKDIYQHIELQPLTLIESRHLLSELLPRVSALPMRLVDFAITGADGNPLQLEEMVHNLIVDEVIDTSGTNWLIRLGSLAELSTLTYQHILKRRVQNLPNSVKEILTTAALIGNYFWEGTLQTLHPEEVELMHKLDQLCDMGFIYRRTSSTFEQTREYIFRHDLMRLVIEELYPADSRQLKHRQIAEWFQQQSEFVIEQIPHIIAAQYVAAGELEFAAEWYGHAATRARGLSAPETAVHYYRLALQHLPSRAETRIQALAYYEGLGQMLLNLAQFSEAAEALTAVHTGAQQTDNSILKIQTDLSLFQLYFIQRRINEAEHHAQKALEKAQNEHQHDLTIWAMAAEGWTMLNRGNIRKAVNLSGEIYKLTKQNQTPFSIGFSRLLLGQIGHELGQYDQGIMALEESIKQFQIVDEPYWQIQGLLVLGCTAMEKYQLNMALAHFDDAHWLAHDLRDSSSTMQALRQLGKCYLYQGQFSQSASQYHRARLLVERSKQQLFRTLITLDIAEMHLSQAVIAPMSTLDLQDKEENIQEAYQWLEEGLKLSREINNPLLESRSLSGLAELFLEDHLLQEARDHALKAIKEAERTLRQRATRQAKLQTAVAWRILGMSLAKEPLQRNQLEIGGRQVSANACFQRSRHLLEEIGQPASHELARTLRAWGIYWLFIDQSEKSSELFIEANEIFRRCNMEWETTFIQHLM